MATINNGTVTVQVTGGVGPYQYTLLNSITNQPIPTNAYPTFQNPVNNVVSNTYTFGNASDNTGNSGLQPGSYRVKIVDGNLCETISNILFVSDATPAPTATATPIPTATPAPTATEVPATATPVPTVEPTATEVPATATPEPTATEVEPTATPEPTLEPTLEPTATEVEPTATPEPTATEVEPTATPEPTLEPTATEVPATATPEPTVTEVPATATPEPTATEVVPTATPLSFDDLGVIAGGQVEPSSIWDQGAGNYFFGADTNSQSNVDSFTCYFTELILTDPSKYGFGNTYQILSGTTLQVGTQLYNSGVPHYGGFIKGIVYNPAIGSYNGHFVHGATYTYFEADMNGIVTYITTDVICAPAPTATPEPTATEVPATATPEPTATEVPATATPEPTSTPIPLATIALVNTISGPYFGNTEGATASTLNNFLCAQGLPNSYSSYNYKTNGLGGFNVPQNGDIIYEQNETTLVTNREFMFAAAVPASSILDWYYVATDANGVATVTQMSPCPTATPVPTATATPVPPTATPVPTSTATPEPTATERPIDPTPTSAPEGSSTFWFHWNGSGGYPGVESLTQPSSAYYLNDNTTTTDFDAVFVDMLANIATQYNADVINSQVFSAIDISQIADGTLQFAANTGDAQKYYIAIPKSVSTTDYTSVAKFKDAANNIPFTLSSKLDFSHLGNAYTLYEVYPDPNSNALTLNIV